MAWRTLFISRPAQLSCQNDHLLLKGEETIKIPLEDIVAMVIETPQVTLTSALLSRAAEFGLMVITCDQKFLPNGIFTGFHRHSRQAKVEREQAGWSEPFKKRLRQKIVRNKILNQARLLETVHLGKGRELKDIAIQVQSGDPGNKEAQAASLYFRHLFQPCAGKGFTRERDCIQNAALNYGYAVIRGAAARAVTAYGLIPSRGIFHHSELNAFNLADDIMEPFRPWVDSYVLKKWPQMKEEALGQEHKSALIHLLYQKVVLQEERMYLLNAVEGTVKGLLAASEAKDVRLYKEVHFADPNKEHE